MREELLPGQPLHEEPELHWQHLCQPEVSGGLKGLVWVEEDSDGTG